MLREDWFLDPKIERLINILVRLGFDCAIRDYKGKPTLYIWKRKNL